MPESMTNVTHIIDGTCRPAHAVVTAGVGVVVRVPLSFGFTHGTAQPIHVDTPTRRDFQCFGTVAGLITRIWPLSPNDTAKSCSGSSGLDHGRDTLGSAIVHNIPHHKHKRSNAQTDDDAGHAIA